jgi:transcriptional regulator with XRE-family HTH domain
MTFAERLKQVRERAGISQREAARRARIHQPKWAALESGAHDNPTLDMLSRIARVFGMDVGELLYGVAYAGPDAEANDEGTG